MAQTQCIGDETLGTACPGGTVTDTSTELPISGLIDTPQVHHARIVATSAILDPGADLYIDPTSNGSGSQELIVQNTYDNLGQLVSKKVGGAASVTNGTVGALGLQTVSYDYNVRGWLTAINDINSTSKLFNFKIGYNEPENGGAPLYDGNISETVWRTGNTDSSLKSYDYAYDALNRIVGAAGAGAMSKFDVSGITYDKNGNLLSLTRMGPKSATPVLNDIDDTDYGTMDVLNYAYHDSEMSNRLYKVRDDGEDAFGFKDSATDVQDYWYDQNGNMTSDLNKGITSISYNHLNRPTQVTVVNSEHNGNVQFIYAADGTRLKKIVSSNGTTTEYAGSYIYKNGQLKFFDHKEGYVEPDGNGNFDYLYTYKDHLGSVRLSYSDFNGNGTIEANTEIIKESNYYPFGMPHRGYNTVVNGTENDHKTYLDQEINKDLGLDWLTFRFRNYDPSIGRFFGVDPISEKFYDISTYQFAHNTPIWKVEIEGLEGARFDIAQRWRNAKQLSKINGKSVEENYQQALELENRGRDGVLEAAADEIPVLGEVKSIAEGDYAGAVIGLVPFGKKARSVFRGAKKFFKNRKAAKILKKNKILGKKGELLTTDNLKKEFEGDDVLEQVTAKFEDGTTTRFDNVVVDAKTGKIKLLNETKTGNGKLTKQQKRFFEDGESATLTGKNSGGLSGQTINSTNTNTRITKVKTEDLE